MNLKNNRPRSKQVLDQKQKVFFATHRLSKMTD